METYRASGAVPVFGAVIAAVAGFVTAGVLGVVYAYLVNLSPFIYINFFATLIFGGAIGVAIGTMALRGKIRNPNLMFGFGLLMGLFGLYTAWAIDPMARFGSEAGPVFSPAHLWAYMGFGYENGFWTIGKLGRDGGAVTGVFLAVVWLIEGGMIVWYAATRARSTSADKLFCEPCDAWIDARSVVLLANQPSTNAALRGLLAGDLSGLASMPKDSKKKDCLHLEVAACPTCRDSNYLSVTRIESKKNKKGEEELKQTDLLTNLRIRHEDVSLVQNAGSEVPEPEEKAPGDEPKLEDFKFS